METKKNPMRILLADDDEDDRDFFKEAFEELKMNMVVRTVNNGMQLMDYLKANEDLLPHIVFLDLNMPIKSGMECLSEIRNTEKLKDITIAIYSTSSSEESIEETFVKGANIYITKPSDFGTLKIALTKVVSINWQFHTMGLNKKTFLLSI